MLKNCRVRIFAFSLAHTICFGVMVVKAVQLRNAETMDLFGGEQHSQKQQQQQLSYLNYWLLLAFIFVGQLLICARWIVESVLNSSSSSENNAEVGIEAWSFTKQCNYTMDPNFVLAEAYCFVLIVLSLLLSSFNRNIKRNYKVGFDRKEFIFCLLFRKPNGCSSHRLLLQS